ncbi:DUF2975 domain-containing protein [Nesterenkonia sp. AN1]|uniref:DUF2975 domain-containing protein n=1 Tax=Nesterenkonia sp. AN1 TaxID=652017 RepID=UPI000A00BF21
MSTPYSTALRAALSLLLLGSLIVQVAIPVNAKSAGEVFPEIEPLTMPYAILAIAAIVGVQVGLIATWRLASMVSKDRIFDKSALKWVDLILVALIGTTALAAAVFVHLIFIVQVGGPPALLGLGGAWHLECRCCCFSRSCVACWSRRSTTAANWRGSSNGHQGRHRCHAR